MVVARGEDKGGEGQYLNLALSPYVSSYKIGLHFKRNSKLKKIK